MQHGNYKKRIFIGRVSDQVVSHRLKTHCPRCEIGPLVGLMGKLHELADGVVYLFAGAIRRVNVVGCDVLPYLI